MRAIILIATVLLSSTVFGQTIIDKHYDHLVAKESTTQVFVSGRMFDFAKYIPDEGEHEAKKIKDFATSIESFNLIYDEKNPDAASEYKKGQRDLTEYDELVRVKSKKARFSLFIQEADGIVTELVGLGAIDSAFVVFSINGQMDLDKVGDMVNMVEKEGLEELTQFRSTDVQNVKIYPNPASTSGYINIEVPENLVGGTARIYDNTGRQLEKIDINGTKLEVKTDEYRAGYHIVELTNGEITHKRKVLVVE